VISGSISNSLVSLSDALLLSSLSLIVVAVESVLSSSFFSFSGSSLSTDFGSS